MPLLKKANNVEPSVFAISKTVPHTEAAYYMTVFLKTSQPNMSQPTPQAIVTRIAMTIRTVFTGFSFIHPQIDFNQYFTPYFPYPYSIVLISDKAF